jgi:hypothetical protein
LDPGDPLFTCEDVGFISTEEGKLGEVSLPEVFSMIGVLKKTNHVGSDGGGEVNGVVVGGGDEFSGNETS